MKSLNDVLNELGNILKPDFEITGYGCGGKHVRVKTSPNRLLDAAKYMLSIGSRIVHVTASDMGFDGIRLMHIYSLEHIDRHAHVILYAYGDGEQVKFPSVAKLTYQANWAERETMELLGVEFDGHPDPRHIFLPFEWPNPVESSSESKAGVKQVTLPIGPYHPAMLEGGFFKLFVDGEDVVDVDIKVGLNHRGIMKLAESRTFWRDLFLVGRICGICSVPHQLAFVNAVERILGVNVPERAEYIRVLMAELNRIHSHLLWLGVAGDLIGFKTLLMWAWKIREPIQDCIELLSGNRVHADSMSIGGVRFDVTKEQLSKVESKLLEVKRDFKKLAEDIASHSIVRRRTEGVGVMSLSDAREAGAVGPTARASGWKIDVRRDSPYSFYDEGHISWDVVVEEAGDVLSRVMVRVKETLVSIDICLQCVDRLKSVGGPVATSELKPFPEGEALSKVEAPRGELVYYIISNGMDIPHTVRIRTPSYRNIAALKFMLKGCRLADAPIIIGSVDPCFSCTDRVMIVDSKRGEQWTLSGDEFKNLAFKGWRG